MGKYLHAVVVHPHNPPYFFRSAIANPPRGYLRAISLMVSNNMIPEPINGRQCAEIIHKHGWLVSQIMDNFNRSIKSITLSVYHQGEKVCFNCLKRFTAKHPITKHHLLAKRFRGMPFYHPHEVLVEVHRQCTVFYHKHYDPFRLKLVIWSADRYLQIAREVQFGFAMLCKDTSILRSPDLTVSPELAPFIFGQASFQTPGDIDLSGQKKRPVAYCKLVLKSNAMAQSI